MSNLFRTVGIQEVPDRDLKNFNANLSEGLQAYNFFGYFFMIAGILFLIFAIVKIRFVFPYIGIILFIIIGYLLFNTARQNTQRRLECLQKGEAVSAKVVSQSRSFNLFSSTRKYTIVLDDNGKKIEVTHKSEELWTKFPVGTDVIGFKYNNQYLFGPEMGITFQFFK